MISIGIVSGGPEVVRIDDWIMHLMRYCGSQGDASAVVNIVYHLPGSVIESVPFKGQRTAKFSMNEKILMIQVAIEPSWVSSSDDELIRKHVYETADAALILAEEEFARHGIEYDLEADRECLRRWYSLSAGQLPPSFRVSPDIFRRVTELGAG